MRLTFAFDHFPETQKKEKMSKWRNAVEGSKKRNKRHSSSIGRRRRCALRIPLDNLNPNT